MYHVQILLIYQHIITIIMILDQGSLGNSDLKVSNINLLSMKRMTYDWGEGTDLYKCITSKENCFTSTTVTQI